MRHRPRFRHCIVTMLVAFALFASAVPAWAAPRERYEPPTSPTPIPSAETGDGLLGTTPDEGDTSSSGAVISAPAVEDAPVPQGNVRARPEPRPVDLTQPTAVPTATPRPDDATATAAPTRPRLDEPVLRWLPEIMDAAKDSGTPPQVIAGVMRLESNGDPRIISPVGARGQMQIMPDNLSAMGIPQELWHDPATNVLAGGRFLAARAADYGSWEQAVGAYFGFGCDVFGTCTETYIAVAMGWAAFYAPAIADPLNSGYGLLPADWSYGPIVPFVEAAPPKVATPPANTPTPTPKPGKTPTAGPSPTEAPTGVPTEAPTEAPVEPTPLPTEEIPTEVPTEVPVEPTEAPVVAPTPEPAAAPPETEEAAAG